jgi:hypothetical protein
MPDRGSGNGNHGGKTESHEKGGGHGDRHPIPGHALKKGAENPSENEQLNGFVTAESLNPDTDGLDGAGFIDHMIQQQGRPDNIKDVQREENAFHLRIGNQFRVRTKRKGGSDQCGEPAGGPGTAAGPIPEDHQEQNHGNGRKRQ